MSMRSRWVVGIDGSDPAVNALRWAAHHSRGRDVELVALQAYHVPAALAVMAAKRGFGVDQLGLAATAGHEVDEAIAGLGDASVESLIIEGNPAREMVESAADAAMLVVGRSGGGDLLHHTLGSVSRYCATHSPVPVAVILPGWKARDLKSIAVGFDGSDNAAAALRWAMDFASEGLSVRAVAAIEHAPWIGQDLTLARFPTEIHDEKQRITAAIDVIDPGGRVERDIELRGARQALTEASTTADLLVVGSRGHGRIAAGLLGSVSASILHSTSCPVVVVPLPAK
jgi:nucleotide-binding universal stress UspA family protein